MRVPDELAELFPGWEPDDEEDGDAPEDWPPGMHLENPDWEDGEVSTDIYAEQDAYDDRGEDAWTPHPDSPCCPTHGTCHPPEEQPTPSPTWRCLLAGLGAQFTCTADQPHTLRGCRYDTWSQ